VIFDEAAQWTWCTEHDGEPGDFTVEDLVPVETDATGTTTTSVAPLTTASAPSSSAPQVSPSPPRPNGSTAGTLTQVSAPATSSTAPTHGVEFASPPAFSFSERLDNDHDIDNVISLASTPGLAARNLEERLLLASDVEPASLEEALRH